VELLALLLPSASVSVPF